MFDWLRIIVAGPKHRTVQSNYDLDLTYITKNIIAMAFPASGFEKLYRNCIEDVANFLDLKHKGRYYIINVSNRPYNTAIFGDRVISYEWQDHQAPCLTTLYQISKFSSNFLRENEQNVIVVHCNHGKGRTGTAIMSLLMFLNNIPNVTELLAFYNKKRFSQDNYVVSMPCQIRYLHFYKQILDNQNKYQHLKSYRLVNVTQQGLGDNYEIKISAVRNNKILYDHLAIKTVQQNKQKQIILMGDIFIEVVQAKLMGSRICRINYHLEFAKFHQQLYIAMFDGRQVKVQNCHHNFRLSLQLKQYCQCYLRQNQQCPCFNLRSQQQKYWLNMHSIISQRKIQFSDIAIQLNGTQTHFES